MKNDRKQHDILIISSSEKISTSLTRVLSDGRYRAVEVRKSASQARREWSERHYDIAIVNIPLSDEPGIELAIDLAGGSPTGVILIASSEISEDVAEKVTDYGIIVLQKPVRSRALSRAVRLLCALLDKVNHAVKKAQTMESRMEEIRIVNRAKWILIDTRNMSEEEAHKTIEKMAMDRCVTKGEIAKEILNS